MNSPDEKPSVVSRLKDHDTADLNAIAKIVTQNAGDRHPLFSVRYGIAVAVLDWVKEREKGTSGE